MIDPQRQSSVPSWLHIRYSPTIVLYQSLNTSTGGTTAMRLLFHALQKMHFTKVFLCNETNFMTKPCHRPSGKPIVFIHLDSEINRSDGDCRQQRGSDGGVVSRRAARVPQSQATSDWTLSIPW